MKSRKTLFVLSLVLLNTIITAQENVPSISLIRDTSNETHPFYDVFSKKDSQYINWLYFHCKGLSNKNILKSSINKPLMFSIQHRGVVVTEAVTNCIHPKLYEDDREQEWISEIPLYGSFPNYINFHINNNPKKLVTIDLLIKKRLSNIKMSVLNENGDLVSTIINENLKQGNHKLYWNNEDIKSGTYLLYSEIDTHLTIHSISVEKNWFANLFSRNKEKYRTKRISFESSNLPKPEKKDTIY